MERKTRPVTKGRQVDPKALEEVRALLGDEPRRRDLLIEREVDVGERVRGPAPTPRVVNRQVPDFELAQRRSDLALR